MKAHTFILLTLAVTMLFTQCKQADSGADAYGNFETEETVVSAESNGRLIYMNADEGDVLEPNTIVALVDTMQLHLQKEQLLAKVRAIRSQSPDISSQVAIFNKQVATNQQQLATLNQEKTRVENLLKADAATPKQLDDINAQIAIVNKQIEVIRSQEAASKRGLSIQQNALLQEAIAVQSQMAQLNDQIAKALVKNPIKGTVTATYTDAAEVVGFGKPLYKIADLSTMILRAYISGDQLVEVKVGDEVTVKVDAPGGGYKDYKGKIDWISSKAEFTPKVIQTKKDRVNLVYAIKINVENDGGIKMGMPAEVVW